MLMVLMLMVLMFMVLLVIMVLLVMVLLVIMVLLIMVLLVMVLTSTLPLPATGSLLLLLAEAVEAGAKVRDAGGGTAGTAPQWPRPPPTAPSTTPP
jgi:hypothetical protein